ncbi:MAG: peptidylprolyl isomerase [Deltaproteobacteria bacterium]|nr:peptidylprolyl isomerase [Deltaproteobacteria bacterium]
MKIAHGTVVAIEFKLTDDDGEEIDSSEESGPLEYLHGFGQIVDGLEAALEGHVLNDKFKVTVPPSEGYGEDSGQEPVRVPRAQLPTEPEPEVGMDLHAVGPDGEEETFWIIEVEEEHVYLSTDHPLAGLNLHFEVKVVGVRAATEEEMSHGHSHGPDGHHH